jgi:hypothetical protein
LFFLFALAVLSEYLQYYQAKQELRYLKQQSLNGAGLLGSYDGQENEASSAGSPALNDYPMVDSVPK